MTKRDASMAGLSSASRRHISLRSPLTRQERAMIRILCKHGWPKSDIAKRMDCSTVTVYNVNNRVTAAGDLDDDYDYVEESFRRDYPPMNMKRENNERSAQRDAEATRSSLDRESNTPSAKFISSRTAAQVSTNTPSSSENTPSISVETPPRNKVQSASGSSQQRVIFVDLEPSPEAERVPTNLPNLPEFLASLEHDLSDILDALVEQHLGTSQKFFAIAMWSEDVLHQLFKEALPQMRVAQRFMLVKGMKAVVEKCK